MQAALGAVPEVCNEGYQGVERVGRGGGGCREGLGNTVRGGEARRRRKQKVRL